jgi:hypothetical protein
MRRLQQLRNLILLEWDREVSLLETLMRCGRAIILDHVQDHPWILVVTIRLHHP